jgi:hypothetical protein
MNVTYEEAPALRGLTTTESQREHPLKSGNFR